MIIQKQKQYEDILKSLEGERNIFVAGCADCAAACKVGGEEEVAAIGAALFAYLDKPYRLVGLRRVSQEETRCRTPRKYKTWKVHQKGDK